MRKTMGMIVKQLKFSIFPTYDNLSRANHNFYSNLSLLTFLGICVLVSVWFCCVVFLNKNRLFESCVTTN